MIQLLPFPDAIASALAGGTTLPGFALMIVMKATLVLAFGIIVALVAGGAGAAVRHSIIAFTLAAALGLPLGMLAAPPWRVAILPAADARQNGGVANLAASLSPPSSESRSVADEAQAGERLSVTNTFSSDEPPVLTSKVTSGAALPSLWIPIIWLVGLLSVLGWMIVGRMGLRRLARSSALVDSPDWRRLVEEERVRAGVDGDVAVLTSSRVSTPLAWGTRSPTIVLPAEASNWAPEHRAVVLRHELAHIARGDALAQMLAGITCAVYWFHPLAWMAARKLRAEQERACDERVLSSGTPATEYAAHLLEVARAARALGANGLVSLAMARPSQLEGRLLAVLNRSGTQHRLSPAARIAGITAALLIFVGLSAFTPMRRASMLPRAVTPTIIATQFVPPASAISEEKSSAPAWSKSRATKVAIDSLFERSVDVRPGGTLELDLNTGAGLTIAGWDQNRVRVTGTLGGRDWRDTEVELERTGSGARLTTRYSMHSRSQSSSHRFEIMVPRRFNVSVESAGGAISITGLQGSFTGSTGGGQIRIERASGSAHLSTGGGQIRVTDSNLSGSVGTGGGSVLIQRVRGGLRGSSGSGPVVYGNPEDEPIVSLGGKSRIYDDRGGVTVGSGGNVTINEGTGEIRDNTTGRIIYRKSGGSVTIGEAMSGADVSTGGGRVVIGRSAGDVSALTGGGDITIGPLDGSAVATTGAGDVRVTLRGAGDHSVEVNSGNGTVTLVLPSNFSGRVDLETGYTERHGRTRIDSDWPLSIRETDYWDDSHGTPRKFVRSRQSIGSSRGGGGGVLRVKTVNGNIILRRGD
jgi:beta-lactamase regulating signal transducer with metallopeptidase domain